MKIGDVIRQARGSRSQTWLANELGVHQTTVSDWEKNGSAPRPEKFNEIEQVLSIPAGTLARIHYGADIPPFNDAEPIPNYGPPPERLSRIDLAGRLSPASQKVVDDLITRLLEAEGLDPHDPDVG